jgi:hypothetical protein
MCGSTRSGAAPTDGELTQALEAWQQALTILDDLRHPSAEQVRSKISQADPETVANPPRPATRSARRTGRARKGNRMTDHVPIPDEDLGEIEQRAHAASPAPWEAFIEARDHTAGDDFIRIGGFDDAQPDMYIQYYLGATSVRVPAADLDFIAHARQDIPRLVAEIRRLLADTQGDSPG